MVNESSDSVKMGKDYGSVLEMEIVLEWKAFVLCLNFLKVSPEEKDEMMPFIFSHMSHSEKRN